MIRQNENMPKVSIIVPVYKAEKYLNRCIDSIIAQTFTDWELLLIDDGSPDRSGDICDEYAKKDIRIRVFHKKNGGVSSARNLGLYNVQGEYVTFVDSDDWIDVNTLNVCFSQIEIYDLDILQFSYTRNERKLGNVLDFESHVCTLKDYINEKKLLLCVGGTIFSVDVIKQNHIRFNEKMKLAEDQLFVLSCMELSKRIMRIPNILYYYYDNPCSATNNERSEDLIYSSFQCIEFKKQHPLFAFRLDDLVLFFIEKLILKGKFAIAYKLLAELKPRYFKRRPWPSKLMASVSQYNVFLGICLGIPLYTIYTKLIKSLSKIKQHILCV